MDKSLQAKHIPDEPILIGLAVNDVWHNHWPRTEPHDPRDMPTVLDYMPPGTPPKLALAKMRSLKKRGLVDGCGCGCRGDWCLPDQLDRRMTRDAR